MTEGVWNYERGKNYRTMRLSTRFWLVMRLTALLTTPDGSDDKGQGRLRPANPANSANGSSRNDDKVWDDGVWLE
ncbi:MAG: hypothetical protein HQK89_14720 [Nitrospirae bacterium]|nr:hypothetical protein [Nitrospirota bacterium]